jgi:3-phosphoshikimate 1-carboxyvinyltransferase
MFIQGGPIRGGSVHSHDDHRIAMAFSIAALRADGVITVEDCDNVNTSFPDFVGLATSAGLRVQADG